MFREELTKILTNKVFYLAIAAVVVLLLLGNIYTSPETGEEYTVIGLALDDEKEEVIGIGDLHARDIMIRCKKGNGPQQSRCLFTRAYFKKQEDNQ